MATEVCIYCGSSRNIQQDHLRAKSKNGVTTVPACAKCNQSKGAKGLMEWFRWLKDNGPSSFAFVLHFENERFTLTTKF